MANRDDLRDGGNASALLGAGGLAFGGAGAARALETEPWAMKYITRHLPEFEVPVFAELAAGLVHGSGEGRMGFNISQLLRDSGVNSYYINPAFSPERVGRTGISDMSPEQQKAWDSVLSIYGGARDKARLDQAMRAGRLSTYTPQELIDVVKLAGPDAVLSGLVQPSSILNERLRRGDYPAGLYSTERGMRYSGYQKQGHKGNIPIWEDGVNPLNHIAAKFNADYTLGGVDVPNMAFRTSFAANFDKPTAGVPAWQQLIPGSQGYNSWLDEHSSWFRQHRHTRDASFLRGYVNKIRQNRGLDDISPDKKIIVLDGGSTGFGITERLNKVMSAISGRDDVHVFVQGGKGAGIRDASGDFSLENPDYNRGVSDIAAAHPDKITLVDFVSPKDVRRLISGGYAHVGYGGSSSASEAMTFAQPYIGIGNQPRYNDDGILEPSLNTSNFKFMAKHYGLDEFSPDVPGGQIDQEGFSRVLNRMLDDPAAAMTAANNRAGRFIADQRARNREVGDIVFNTLLQRNGGRLPSRVRRPLRAAQYGSAGLGGLLSLAGIISAIRAGSSSGHDRRRITAR